MINLASAGWALLRHPEGRPPGPALLGHPLQELGDDVPGPLDPYQVPFPEILPLQLFAVMKGGS